MLGCVDFFSSENFLGGGGQEIWGKCGMWGELAIMVINKSALEPRGYVNKTHFSVKNIIS